MATRSQRTDEHLRIGRVPHHPHAIPEHGATGKRRSGVYCNHTNALFRPALAQFGYEHVRERRLTRTRSPCDAEYKPGLWPFLAGQELKEFGQALRILLQKRHQPGCRTRLTSPGAVIGSKSDQVCERLLH
jgi:hypothetical protein